MKNDENNKELLEWYYGNQGNGLDVVVSNLTRRGGLGAGDGSGPGKGPCGAEIRRSEIDEPSTTDMSSVPPESPQSDIQAEIRKRQEREKEQPTTDEVAYEDKRKMYRAFGMMDVLQGKMKELYSMTNAYQNKPQRREQLYQDVKQITRELSDSLSELWVVRGDLWKTKEY